MTRSGPPTVIGGPYEIRAEPDPGQAAAEDRLTGDAVVAPALAMLAVPVPPAGGTVEGPVGFGARLAARWSG